MVQIAMDKRQRWHTRVAFIMAAVGSAVGLGNIWRFPYIAYENGGGAFFVPYLVSLVLAGIPLMILEYGLGIVYQKGAPGALEKINSSFKWVGWLALLVGLTISFYYVPIIGWSWHYMTGSPSYSWSAPTRQGTVFFVPYSPYESDTEKDRIRRFLNRNNISGVRLIREGNLVGLQSDLEDLWGKTNVSDITFWTDQGRVKEFVKKHYSNESADHSADTVYVYLASYDPYSSEEPGAGIQSWMSEFYQEKLRAVRKKRGDWVSRLSPARKVEFIRFRQNAEKYFNRVALGGFQKSEWQTENLLSMSIKRLRQDQFKLEDLEASGVVDQAHYFRTKKDGEEVHFLSTLSPKTRKLWQELVQVSRELSEATSDQGQSKLRTEQQTIKSQLVSALEQISDRRLQQNDGEDYRAEMFSLNYELILWSLLTWALMYLIVFKGVGVLGRVAMWTVPIPLFLLGILIVVGMNQPGAMEGLRLYLSPEWDKIAKPKVWLAAFSQIFFTLSLGFGIMIAYASYQPEDSDINNNSFITSFANCATSFYAGFAVFSVLGALAWALNAPVEGVVASGPGLVFTVYPVALMELPFGNWLGVLFFSSLLMLGINSGFSIVEAIITGLNDAWERVPHSMVALIVCIFGAAVSVLFCMKSGLMWLDIVDHFVSGSFGLPLVGFMECLAVGLFFNIDEFRELVNERSELQIGDWWNVLIQVVIPALLLFLLASALLREAGGTYGNYQKVLPGATTYAGWYYFGTLLFLAFWIAGSWTGVIWIGTGGLLLFTMHQAGLEEISVMTTIGIMMLCGGMITCILNTEPDK